MRFTWDQSKNRGNQIKHGVSFETATLVFFDPLHLSTLDRVVEGEQRWQTMGMVRGNLLLLVSHIVDEEDQRIRIISARRATRRERIEYEEARDV